MKKWKIVLSLLVLAGMQNLVAEDAMMKEGTITAKLKVEAKGKGRFNLSGEDAMKRNNIGTEGEAKVNFEADYNGIAGVNVQLKGSIKGTKNLDSSVKDAKIPKGTKISTNDNEDLAKLGSPGGTDAHKYVTRDIPVAGKATGTITSLEFHDAYAYASLLAPWGVDRKMVDLYVKSGLFRMDFDNAKYAGNHQWLADVDYLDRNKGHANMQFDLKIMDMLTVRYGFALAKTNTARLDMGWALMFSKAFGDHKIDASAAYLLDSSENKGSTMSKKPQDFDQLGFSLAYTGSFATMKLMPFFNFRFKGLANKPKYYSYMDSEFGWSAGLKFQFMDAAKSYDMFGIGLDIGGNMRNSLDYKDDETKQKVKYYQNEGFKGLGVKIWSDALKGVMGKNYLSIWTKARFEFNDPGKPHKLFGADADADINRKDMLTYFGFGVEQYFVNVDNASVKLKAAIEASPSAPYSTMMKGKKVRFSSLPSPGDKITKAYTSDMKIFIDLGLEGSFTSVFKEMVK